jgi:hypothetical protein
MGNRAMFFDRLRQALSMAKRENRCLRILSIDLDDLKQINDRTGAVLATPRFVRLHDVSAWLAENWRRPAKSNTPHERNRPASNHWTIPSSRGTLRTSRNLKRVA